MGADRIITKTSGGTLKNRGKVLTVAVGVVVRISLRSAQKLIENSLATVHEKW